MRVLYEVTVGPDDHYFKIENQRENYIREEWRRDGVLDRTHGPAVIVRNLDTAEVVQEEWYKDGVLHRAPNDGPARFLKKASVISEWRQDGVLHRDGAPAKLEVDLESGLTLQEVWCLHGKAHRIESPSVVERDEHSGVVTAEQWHRNGLLHRVGGPAQIYRDPHTGIIDTEEWYIDGLSQSDGGLAKIECDRLADASTSSEHRQFNSQADPANTNAPDQSL